MSTRNDSKLIFLFSLTVHKVRRLKSPFRLWHQSIGLENNPVFITNRTCDCLWFIYYRISSFFIDWVWAHTFMPNLPSEVEGIAWCIAFMLEAVYIVLGNFCTLVLFAVKKRLRKRSLFLVINSNINSSFVQSINAAEYLRIDSAHVIVSFITLTPLSIDFNSFLKRPKYSFISLVAAFKLSKRLTERMYHLHRTSTLSFRSLR